MEMVRVWSSAIKAVGYDPQSMRMRILFTSGGAYDYCRVPQHVYDGLMAAPSKGTYFDRVIRDRYHC